MSAADVAAIRGDLNTVHEAVRNAEAIVRADINTVHQTVIGKTAALEEIVRQLSANQGVEIDYARVEAVIRDALAQGIELTVKAKGSE